MKTNIKSTGITVTSNVSDYITKRLTKLEKLLKNDPSAQCDIELARITGHQKGDIFHAEIHIVAASKNCYASADRSDLLWAIDEVRDSIMSELRAGKGKRVSAIRRSGARVKYMVKGLWPWGKEKYL